MVKGTSLATVLLLVCTPAPAQTYFGLHLADATDPTNRGRDDYGMGERVYFYVQIVVGGTSADITGEALQLNWNASFSPSSYGTAISWDSIEGKYALTGPKGNVGSLNVTVTLTGPTTINDTITFYRPTGLQILSVTDQPWPSWQEGPPDAKMGAYNEFEIIALPDTVNFYWLDGREQLSAANPSSTTLPGHDPGQGIYCVLTHTDADAPYPQCASSRGERILMDHVGVGEGGLLVTQCSTEIPPGQSVPVAVDTNVPFEFPDQWKDSGGNWIEFEQHQVILKYKLDTTDGYTYATLGLTNQMTGSGQGPWQ